MVDGGDQAAAFGAAFDRGLPALLGVVRESVERGVATASPATFALRCSLLAFVRTAEWGADLVLRAERIGGDAPANLGPRQVTAPIGPSVERIVPRWPGHDPRLPPGDPHP